MIELNVGYMRIYHFYVTPRKLRRIVQLFRTSNCQYSVPLQFRPLTMN